MPAHELTSWPGSLGQKFEAVLASRWTPWVVNLAALALLVYGMTQWTWRLIQGPSPAQATSPLPVITQSTMNVQPLVDASIFGRPPVAAAGSVDPNQLPISSLNIVVTGVMASGKNSQAMMSVSGAPEIAVGIGQEITSGATLQAVYADRIVLQRGSILEMVLLHEDEAAKLPAGSIVQAENPVRQLGKGNYVVDRNRLTAQVQASPEMLTQASVSPGTNGLLVRQVQAGSMFEKLGLRVGDIVHRINGQQVSSLDDVFKVYAQLSAAQTARVQVELARAGKTEVLEYNMQ